MPKAKTAAHPKEISDLLFALREALLATFAQEIVGIYLFGSLTYNDFQPDRSDIDLVVVTRTPLSAMAIAKVAKIHGRLAESFPKWSQRTEVSYTPLAMLQESGVPPEGRPYFGEGRLYPAAQYGNEWPINNYLLRTSALPLYGPPFALIAPEVPIAAVQEAVRRDLVDEWQPKLDDPIWLDNPHYCSYLVLNLCRILTTLQSARMLSKSESAQAISRKYPRWKPLITAANDWRYGQPFTHQEDTLAFLRFAIEKASKVAQKPA